jgi:DNA-binding PadR family transcriptional regulator
VYAALERLEQRAFVRSARSEPSPVRGGKRKRLFEVTPLGFRAVRDLRRLREQIWKTIEEGQS